MALQLSPPMRSASNRHQPVAELAARPAAPFDSLVFP